MSTSNKAVVHREIGIDCGHRVPDHGSKCRSPHGHRYRIIVTCAGDVLDEPGDEAHGMVVDFGEIKSLMMDILDAIFDHAFVVYKHDAVMMKIYFPGLTPEEAWAASTKDISTQIQEYGKNLATGKPTEAIKVRRTLISDQDPDGMKIVPVNYTPTAENMAKHMFDMLRTMLHRVYPDKRLQIMNLRLYETPNGWVDYPGEVFARELSGWQG